MNLTEARANVIDSVLHVATGSYDSNRVDRAIRWAGNRFCVDTQCSRVTVPVTVNADDTTADIITAVSNVGSEPFHPNAIQGVWIGNYPVKVVDYATIQQKYRCSTAQSGRPCEMAFEDTYGVATLYPMADQTYVLNFDYWEPFTFWEPTDDALNPDLVVLNIDDRWIRDVLTAAGAWMVRGEQGNPWAIGALRQFEADIMRARGQTIVNSARWVRQDPDGGTYQRGY